jgi:hypothetical protein
MTLPEILSVVSSVVGIAGGPISVYFSWKASTKAGKAVQGADELAKRMTQRALYAPTGEVIDHKAE